MKLLTVNNAKTLKGELLGYLTAILHLLPADLFGHGVNLCPSASAGCKAACLNTAGMGRFDNVQAGRRRRTEMFVNEREKFEVLMAKDIELVAKQAERLGLIPAVRPNGTSDIPSLARIMAKQFPNIQFYDYTKIPKPYKRELSNYHLTFSLSESNRLDAIDALENGVNVAVVFDVPTKEKITAMETRKKAAELKNDSELVKKLETKIGLEYLRVALPDSWLGYEVIDGDISDLRFLDKRDSVGRIVGLRAKADAKKDTSGFVQKSKIIPRMVA